MKEEVGAQCGDGPHFPVPRGKAGEGKGVSKGMSGKVGEASTPAHYIKCLEAL